MYTDFFGLTEKPFAITPDPLYLFMSERHSEALAHLVYGVTESGGFIQLTGEVGTGKTTLARSLLDKVPENVDVALILNPQLSAMEFLQTICEELGIPPPSNRESIKALVNSLNEYLLAAHARGRRTILMVDEAQNLPVDVLEEVRLLTNLETAKQKLLQIILIGQPELRDLLARNDLRQLAQRVTARYHLQPLTRDESDRYINHRLNIAGAKVEIFTRTAKHEVYRLTGGIPRIINVICDRALLGAYSRGARTVDRKLLREAASEVAGSKLKAGLYRWRYSAVAVSALILISLGGLAVLQEGKLEQVAAVPEAPALKKLQPEPVEDAAEDPSFIGEPATETLSETASESLSEMAIGTSLETLLRQKQAMTGLDSAMKTLFKLWGAEYDPGLGSACQQAEASGLSCLAQRGTWNVIRQLNRPAILNLTDSEGYEYRTVLTGLEGELGRLAIGDVAGEFPRDEISKYWYGEYLLLWRPAGGRSRTLSVGMRDDLVLWLRDSLARVDPAFASASSDPGFFDRDLAEKVKGFQRSNRLKVDGLAGQQTQIILNSGLGLENIPRLVE